jgi:coproporphyrinogen III oxidase-like Fe-S oxidoreductase
MFEKFSISGVNALPRFGSSKLATSAISGLKPINKEIALYIHIPYCKSICHFCMLRRGAKAIKEVPKVYIDAIIEDLHSNIPNLEGCRINSIYFGGGTPSMLHPGQFELILTAIKSAYAVNENVEITFEGESSTLKNNELLSCLKSNDVQRISFGLQTFDPALRTLLGRTDTIEDIQELFQQLSLYNFKEVNVDYLYNLPDTTADFVYQELEQLIRLAPTSIDFHPLKYISCSRHMLQNIIDEKRALPTASERIEMFNVIRNWNFENGFKEQFVDQYSIYENTETNQYMRNLYGLDGGEYLGIGPGSRSHFGDIGFTKVQSIDSYIQSLSEKRSPVDKSINAPLIDNYIACFPKRNDFLPVSVLERSSNPAFYKETFKALAEHGYLLLNDAGYKLTSTGLNWYQNMQEELLSPGQRFRHKENIPARISKFSLYGDYFKNIGELL